MRLRFAPRAERDLEEIADFIAADNPARAAHFIIELRAQAGKLRAAPRGWPERPALGEGVRMMPYGRYLIFYRLTDSEIRIERILHGARDVGEADL